VTVTISPQPIPLIAVLIRLGFTEVRAELWSRFVDEAVKILDQAAQELRRADVWTAFGKKRGALSKPKVRKKTAVVARLPIEDAITAELGHIARRLRAALPSGHFLRLQEVVFGTEHLIESETRTGRYSRKVDFFIYSQIGEAPPELAIEAKPLRSVADISGRYLGADGIGCFFSADSVYTEQALAGMLAYTINVETRSHLDEIRQAMTNFLPEPLTMEHVALPSQAFPILCSRHDRRALSLGPVAIVHLEMLFAPDVTPI
jgi:hypothetical protein